MDGVYHIHTCRIHTHDQLHVQVLVGEAQWPIESSGTESLLASKCMEDVCTIYAYSDQDRRGDHD